MGKAVMIYHREYQSYEEYVSIQGYKARKRKEYLLSSNTKRIKSFVMHFKRFKKYMHPGKVLCLGARTGCEVKAAIQCGFPGSIGIDLHPLCDSVMKADWHDLPFGAAIFENVFTNSLDHCLNFTKLASEIKRVLIPLGIFIFETHTKYAFDSRIPGDEVDNVQELLESSVRHTRNSMFWDSINDISNKFIELDFILIHKQIRNGSSTIFLLKKY